MLTEIPVGLDAIMDTYGSLDDPQFEAENIVTTTLPYFLLYDGKPVSRLRCHRLIVENVLKMFEDIKAGGFEDQVKNYSGMYNRRSIRGHASHPSTHSWGISLDLEAERYPLGSLKRFPPEILAITRACGFFNGADFKARKDPMHFQLCMGY